MARRLLIALAALSLAGSASVQAETLLTGFGGVAFAGATDRSRGTYGGSIGFLGHGPFGFEAEFATTPDFFGSSSDSGAFTENDVVTLMGSFLLATPGNLRFYGAVGGGLMKTRLADPGRFFSLDSNDFGINVGGGLVGFFGAHVGLRADIRYFRDLQDADPDGEFDLDFGNVDYWRAVGGITLKF